MGSKSATARFGRESRQADAGDESGHWDRSHTSGIPREQGEVIGADVKHRVEVRGGAQEALPPHRQHGSDAAPDESSRGGKKAMPGYDGYRFMSDGHPF